LNIQVLLGSAATELRRGGIFCLALFRSLSTNASVKELLQLVHIYQKLSYK